MSRLGSSLAWTTSIRGSIRISDFSNSKRIPISGASWKAASCYSYGAKTIPEGGYWAQPQYYFNGGLIIGDAAGFLNSMRLKGIHLAFKTGMLAAQAAGRSARG